MASFVCLDDITAVIEKNCIVWHVIKMRDLKKKGLQKNEF